MAMENRVWKKVVELFESRVEIKIIFRYLMCFYCCNDSVMSSNNIKIFCQDFVFIPSKVVDM